MDENRFAPPKAAVEGSFESSEAAPPLWNPNAAASWCLLFTPVFGSWLHRQNWRALGETQRASSANTWFIVSIAVVIGSAVLAAMPTPLAGGVRLINFAYLIGWYYAAAKPQTNYVKARFGDGYPRRGWGVPIVWAIVIIIAVIVSLGLLIGLVRGA